MHILHVNSSTTNHVRWIAAVVLAVMLLPASASTTIFTVSRLNYSQKFTSLSQSGLIPVAAGWTAQSVMQRIRALNGNGTGSYTYSMGGLYECTFTNYGGMINCIFVVHVTGRNGFQSQTYMGDSVGWWRSTTSNPVEAKDLGCGADQAEDTVEKRVGNPCNPATGNKFEVQSDYVSPDGYLDLNRYYNSYLPAQPINFDAMSVGYAWMTSFSGHINNASSSSTSIIVRNTAGRSELFQGSATTGWQGSADSRVVVSPSGSGYSVAYRDGSRDQFSASGQLVARIDRSNQATGFTYNSEGRLATVTSPFGHQLNMTYLPDGSLSTVTDPNNKVIRYTVDGNYNLSRVDYPDGTATLYYYEKAGYPNHLTGIAYIDTLGTVTRYSTYDYDSTGAGRAVVTQHADVGFGGPQERFGLAYDDSTGQATVTDAAGTQNKYSFQTILGVRKLIHKLTLSDNKSLYQSYDANGNLTCRRAEEGRVTTYTYNSTNQRTGMTVGLSGASCSSYTTTPETRTTTYQYLSPTLDIPTVIEIPSVYAGQKKRVSIAYTDARFPTLPTAITQSGYTPTGTPVSRTVGISYNGQGQVQTIDGPRTDVSDVTTFDYYVCSTGGACGQLKTVMNALGHITHMISTTPQVGSEGSQTRTAW